MTGPIIPAMPRARRRSRVTVGGRGLIHAYGLFWSAHEVNWAPRSSGQGGRFRLLGRIGAHRMQICDFRPQRGIYVLYDDYGPYYVGLTSRAPLGDRLKQHLSDYHEDRWERFSWFGFRAVSGARLADGTRALRALPKASRADSRSAIADIEALLIQSLGTHHRGNAHQEHFRQGDLWDQVMLRDYEHYLSRVERPLPSRTRKPEHAARVLIRHRDVRSKMVDLNRGGGGS